MVTITSFPESKIATYPLSTRDSSKLLIFKNGQLNTDIFSNIDKYIPAESLMIYNDSKVIRARLIFQKPTGAEIEIFCLEPFQPESFKDAFQQKGNCCWKCLIGNLKKWKEGAVSQTFFHNGEKVTVGAQHEKGNDEWHLIKFNWNPAHVSFGEILEQIGKTPIPPYLNRGSEEIDLTRYQTIYSVHHGSIAAPTAGFHFTPLVFEKLDNKNILSHGITLHVGAGTFIPIKVENVFLHKMHFEYFYVTREALQYLLKHYGNITAIGTTSLRALESIYWMGVKLIEKADEFNNIDQWDAYKNSGTYSPEIVLQTLLDYYIKKNIYSIGSRTSLMIMPGYNFKLVQRLITNFHQPKSTLLLLVAAFIGNKNWKRVYEYALNNDFRFLTYGDSSLLIPSV